MRFLDAFCTTFCAERFLLLLPPAGPRRRTAEWVLRHRKFNYGDGTSEQKQFIFLRSKPNVYENIRNMDNLTPKNASKYAHLKPILQEFRGVEAKTCPDCGFSMSTARHFAAMDCRFSFRWQGQGVGLANGGTGAVNSTTAAVSPSNPLPSERIERGRCAVLVIAAERV